MAIVISDLTPEPLRNGRSLLLRTTMVQGSRARVRRRFPSNPDSEGTFSAIDTTTYAIEVIPHSSAYVPIIPK